MYTNKERSAVARSGSSATPRSVAKAMRDCGAWMHRLFLSPMAIKKKEYAAPPRIPFVQKSMDGFLYTNKERSAVARSGSSATPRSVAKAMRDCGAWMHRLFLSPMAIKKKEYAAPPRIPFVQKSMDGFLYTNKERSAVARSGSSATPRSVAKAMRDCGAWMHRLFLSPMAIKKKEYAAPPRIPFVQKSMDGFLYTNKERSAEPRLILTLG